ncbi:hypothetical protein FOZ62_004533, partial [Perkinsus olseni]
MAEGGRRIVYRHFLTWEAADDVNCSTCALPGDDADEVRGAMVQCDGCRRWFHCVAPCSDFARGMRNDDAWYCASCRVRKAALGPIDAFMVVIPAVRLLRAARIGFLNMEHVIVRKYLRCAALVGNNDPFTSAPSAAAIASLWRATGEQCTAVDFLVALNRDTDIVLEQKPVLFVDYNTNAAPDAIAAVQRLQSSGQPSPAVLIAVASDSTAVAPREFTADHCFGAVSCLYIPEGPTGLSCSVHEEPEFDRLLQGAVAVLYLKRENVECANCRTLLPQSSFAHKLCVVCSFRTCTQCSVEVSIFALANGRALRCPQCRGDIDLQRDEIKIVVKVSRLFLRDVLRSNPLRGVTVDTITVPAVVVGDTPLNIDPIYAHSALRALKSLQTRTVHDIEHADFYRRLYDMRDDRSALRVMRDAVRELTRIEDAPFRVDEGNARAADDNHNDEREEIEQQPAVAEGNARAADDNRNDEQEEIEQQPAVAEGNARAADDNRNDEQEEIEQQPAVAE